MSETSSAEPGAFRLIGLVALTVPVAVSAAAAMIYCMAAVTPDAPQRAVEAVSRPIIAPAASLPPVSRVKPLLTHLKRLHKPVKRRRVKR